MKKEQEFDGYDEPIGTIISLREDSPRARLAKHFFDEQMFRYFHSLSSGQTGWGVSFNIWLSIHGWDPVGYRSYERIEGMEVDNE